MGIQISLTVMFIVAVRNWFGAVDVRGAMIPFFAGIGIIAWINIWGLIQ